MSSCLPLPWGSLNFNWLNEMTHWNPESHGTFQVLSSQYGQGLATLRDSAGKNIPPAQQVLLDSAGVGAEPPVAGKGRKASSGTFLRKRPWKCCDRRPLSRDYGRPFSSSGWGLKKAVMTFPPSSSSPPVLLPSAFFHSFLPFSLSHMAVHLLIMLGN